MGQDKWCVVPAVDQDKSLLGPGYTTAASATAY